MNYTKTIYDKDILNKKVNGIYNKLIKRLIDLILSILLFALISPFFIFLMLTLLITSGRPIFYKPYRGGYENNQFRIIKFRTMIKNADKIGGGTTALYDKRITKFGNVLRKTKLDEIPQLINIIFGSMSFIGPRPELLQYTTMYNEVEKYILKVRPGITDFSSLEFINLDEIVGSNNPDKFYEENILNKKNNLRLKYIFNLSLKTDIKIFVFTIVRVLEKIIRVIWRIIWKKSK